MSWLSDKWNDAKDAASGAVGDVESGVESVGSAVVSEGEHLASEAEAGIVDTSGSVYQGAQNAYHEAEKDVETVEQDGEKAWDVAKENGEKAWNLANPYIDKGIEYGQDVLEGVEKEGQAAEHGLQEAAPTIAKDVEEAEDAAEGAPGVGTIINGLSASYHAAAGAYDYANGNRDGAVMQGGQAVTNIVGMIPGASTVIGDVDMGLAAMGTAAQAVDPADADSIPTSTADVVSGLAVYATNALLGQDTGKTTATRQGEVGAGTRGLANGVLNTIGGGFVPGLGNVVDWVAGDKIESGASKADGTLFGTPADAPATGEGTPNLWQRAGQDTYRARQRANEEIPQIPLPAPQPQQTVPTTIDET